MAADPELEVVQRSGNPLLMADAMASAATLVAAPAGAAAGAVDGTRGRTGALAFGGRPVVRLGEWRFAQGPTAWRVEANATVADAFWAERATEYDLTLDLGDVTWRWRHLPAAAVARTTRRVTVCGAAPPAVHDAALPFRVTAAPESPRVRQVHVWFDATEIWRQVWPREALRRRPGGYPVDAAPRRRERDEDLSLARLLAGGVTPDAVAVAHCLSLSDGERFALERLRAAGIALAVDADTEVFSDDFLSQLGPWIVAYMADTGPRGVERVRARAHLRRELLGAADGVTTSSPRIAAAVAPFVRPGAPVVVVPDGLEVGPYLEARRQRPPGGDSRPVLLYIGRCRPADHFAATGMGAAWARVAERRPDLRLVVVGAPEPGLERFVPPPRLEYLPWTPVAERVRSLAAADVVCVAQTPYPRDDADSPRRLFEAAAAGAAVVASAEPFAFEAGEGFVDHGGLVVDHRADAWEAAVEQLLGDVEDRDARSFRLEQWVLSEHTSDRMAPRWADAWRVIVAHARR